LDLKPGALGPKVARIPRPATGENDDPPADLPADH
jgi:hypothetical protein